MQGNAVMDRYKEKRRRARPDGDERRRGRRNAEWNARRGLVGPVVSHFDTGGYEAMDTSVAGAIRDHLGPEPKWPNISDFGGETGDVVLYLEGREYRFSLDGDAQEQAMQAFDIYRDIIIAGKVGSVQTRASGRYEDFCGEQIHKFGAIKILPLDPLRVIKVKQMDDLCFNFKDALSLAGALQRENMHRRSLISTLSTHGNRSVAPFVNIVPDLCVAMACVAPCRGLKGGDRKDLVRLGRVLADGFIEARDIKFDNLGFLHGRFLRVIDPDQFKDIRLLDPSSHCDMAMPMTFAMTQGRGKHAMGRDSSPIGLQATAWAILCTLADASGVLPGPDRYNWRPDFSAETRDHSAGRFYVQRNRSIFSRADMGVTLANRITLGMFLKFFDECFPADAPRLENWGQACRQAREDALRFYGYLGV